MFRRHKVAAGLDIVIVPRREMLDAPFSNLEADYQRRSRAAGPRRSTSRSPHRVDAGARGARARLSFERISFLFLRYLPGVADFSPRARTTWPRRVRTHGSVRGSGLAFAACRAVTRSEATGSIQCRRSRLVDIDGTSRSSRRRAVVPGALRLPGAFRAAAAAKPADSAGRLPMRPRRHPPAASPVRTGRAAADTRCPAARRADLGAVRAADRRRDLIPCRPCFRTAAGACCSGA